MKIELPLKRLPHIQENWPGQFEVFSYFNQAVNLPSVLFVVTTKKENGLPNAQPNAWGMLLGSGDEPKFVFSLMRSHDTYRLLKVHGECIINIPSDDIREKVLKTMEHFGDGEDEIKASGLTSEPGRYVDVPRIRECHTHLECRLDTLLDLEQGKKVNALAICSVVGGAIDSNVCRDDLLDALNEKSMTLYINEHLNPKTGVHQGMGSFTKLDLEQLHGYDDEGDNSK